MVIASTMLPISVEPRANANSTSRHPPWENSFDVVRVWRFSIGLVAARPTRASATRVLVYMMLRIIRMLNRRTVIGTCLGLNRTEE